MGELKVGNTAPAFSLKTEKGDQVTLAEAIKTGPVVLIFYPMDNTPGCTAQLCVVRNDGARYKAAGVTVYGVNGGGADSHQKFIEKHGLTAPLLVDPSLGTAAAYNAVIGFGPLKMIRRTVVGVGPDGKIVFYERGSPSTDTILAAMPVV